MIWIKFSIIAFFVVIFCIRLSCYAERLADAKNIGKGFIGFVLLGFITSIPELISTLSCTVYLDNPILATGNIIGSNNANIFILFVSLLTAGSIRKSDGSIDIESGISQGFCVIMTSVFLLGAILNGAPVIGKSVFVYLIMAIFVLSIAALYKVNDSEISDKTPPAKKALDFFFYFKLIFFASGLVVLSFFLSVVVDEMSRVTSVGTAAAGAIFLAWATSLPELVVTVTSVIKGFVEMGIGNILGSNIFNMFVLSFAELCSRSGASVFSRDSDMIILAVFQILLLGILLIMIFKKKLTKIGKISLLPVFSMAIYILGLSFLN